MTDRTKQNAIINAFQKRKKLNILLSKAESVLDSHNKELKIQVNRADLSISMVYKGRCFS